MVFTEQKLKKHKDHPDDMKKLVHWKSTEEEVVKHSDPKLSYIYATKCGKLINFHSLNVTILNERN